MGLTVDRGSEELRVGRKRLQQPETRAETEDGEGGIRWGFLEVEAKLIVDVALGVEWSVEGVEKKDVEGGVGRNGGVVGEVAGW
jgi:hypothetical protein